jgi:hypothetical protein
MTDADKQVEEMAALRKRVEELEAKANPPEPKPFVPQPYQRYDPTAGMCMALCSRGDGQRPIQSSNARGYPRSPRTNRSTGNDPKATRYWR